MIDRRGRLFGLINIVDAAVLAALVVAIGVGMLAYRSMTLPPPRIDALTPAVVSDAAATVEIHGAHLPPFARVVLSEAGRPPTVSATEPAAVRAPVPLEATVQTVGASVMTVKLPPLTEGGYDVYFFDADRQIGLLPAALTMKKTAPRRAEIEVLVRFHVYDDQLWTVTGTDRLLWTAPGDEPLADRTGRMPDAARVIEVRRGAEVDEVQMRLAKYPGEDPTFFLGRRRPRRIVDVRLRVPVLEIAPGRWEYRHRRVRAGEPFAFDAAYHLEGEVIWMNEPD